MGTARTFLDIMGLRRMVCGRSHSLQVRPYVDRRVALYSDRALRCRRDVWRRTSAHLPVLGHLAPRSLDTGRDRVISEWRIPVDLHGFVTMSKFSQKMSSNRRIDTDRFAADHAGR